MPVVPSNSLCLLKIMIGTSEIGADLSLVSIVAYNAKLAVYLACAFFIVASSPPNIQIFPTLIHAQVRAFTHARFPNTLRSIAAAMPKGREKIRHHLG